MIYVLVYLLVGAFVEGLDRSEDCADPVGRRLLAVVLWPVVVLLAVGYIIKNGRHRP